MKLDILVNRIERDKAKKQARSKRTPFREFPRYGIMVPAARAATPPEPPRGSPQPAPDPADIREEANRVFVGNLPREATKSGLYRLFTEYGDVAEIHISMANGESKGYAFVEFITSDAATTVLNTKTIVYDKWLLNIRPARARQ